MSLSLPLFVPALGTAQTRTVWQIGKFDQSPVEFAREAKDNLTFHVGSSEPQKDWPRGQKTGGTQTIVFALDKVQSRYLFKVALLVEQPRIPALQIVVNGHTGKFYLHPQLSYSRSDFTYAFDPHEAQSALEIEIPAAFLKVGDNALSISCVDDPTTKAGDEEVGGLSYDALSLEEGAGTDSTDSREITAVVEPTIFFRAGAAGLTETVDAFVRFPGPWVAGTATLATPGQSQSAQLNGGEWGEERLSFDLPEWTGIVQAKLHVPGKRKADLAFSLAPQRKWTIFVVPHTHLDIGYTDYQGKVAETQARVLTQAANLIQDHPDFRFSMDGSWNLEQLLLTRPETKQREILGLIASGKMAMPVQYCNLLTGYASLETLYRSLYTSSAIATEHHLPFEYANITDVPTYSGSYPSVLAASGVKYWVAAANNDRAPIFYYDHWNEESPFWWEGPDGARVLFWYSRHYEQVQTLFGLPPQLNAIRESLPIYLQAYNHPSYKPDVALIYGTQVENTDLFPSTATFVDDWNKVYAFPKLTYKTFPEFFHYVEEHYAKDLPTVKADGGGYWEDGIGSDSYYAARDRENQHRALSAEVLASSTHSVDSNLNPPRDLFADIWRNIILFAEHTWLSYNSVSQPEHEQSLKQQQVKDGRVDRASLEIEDVTNRSLSQLADQIHIPDKTLVVFNSLNWKRDVVVETDLFAHPTLTDLTTQQEVPLEVLAEKENFLHVRFLAKDLPPVGYKCFRIAYAETGGAAGHSPAVESTIENSYYRIEADPESGAIRSILDKQLQREIVDAKSAYKFGQYLYVTGGDGDTQMVNPFPALPPGELTINGSAKGRVDKVEHLAWGHSLVMTSSSVNTPRVETEVLLFNDEKKIEFRYRIGKDYTNSKEAAYIAFPVAEDKPVFHFATQQAWVDPAKDLMKGGSLEWFNIQQWMEVGGPQISVGIVPVNTPLASFGDINRGKWPGSFQPGSATIFSYAMNNYWHTNYRAGQSGEFDFRYAITSGPQLDGQRLTHLGFEEMRPAEVDYVVSQDKVGNPPRPLPPEGASFLSVSGPDVALVTWKGAEDGHGSILRLQETAGQASETTISLPRGRIASAQLCSGVEKNLRSLSLQDNSVKLSFKPFEVLTVRVEMN